MPEIEQTEDRAFFDMPVPLSSPQSLTFLGGGRSTSGVHVDRVTVLGVPAVFRCIQIISGWISKLPLQVFKKSKDGSREIDEEHPAQWLLAHHPSNLYTPRDFKKTMISHVLLHGNAFAWIIREDVTGQPDELLILNPECTGAAVVNGRLLYFTRIGTDYKTILPENVLHWKGLSHDGIMGMSIIDILCESFGVSIASQKFLSLFFKNDGSPGATILKFPQKVDQAQADEILKIWHRGHGGLENKHRVAVLGAGGDVVPFSINFEQAQFLETRQFEVSQIATIFGVPKTWLGLDGTSDGYNGLEQVHRGFLNGTLDDILVGGEEECARKLLKESERIRDSRFVSYDRRALEQADSKAHAETLVLLVNNGLMSENECRAELNRPAISGSDGDRMRLPLNISFVDLISQTGEKDLALADKALTDEPDPPAEIVAGTDTQTGEPVQVNPIDPTFPQRFKALQDATYKRLNERLNKAYSHAVERRMDFDIESHIPVFLESGLGMSEKEAKDYITTWINTNDH